MTKFIAKIQSYVLARETDDEGATMVEYGLMVTLIALVALAAVTLTGTNVAARFDAIAAAL